MARSSFKARRTKERASASGSRSEGTGARLRSGRPRVIIADDHPVVRAGLRTSLEEDFDVVAEVGDGRALVQAVKALHPDVVVADVSMPELNGIDATRAIRALGGNVRVLMLSINCTDAVLTEALDAGATGYMLKEAGADELRKAVHAVARGDAYFSPAVAKLLADNVMDRGKPGGRTRLSPREREVVQLITEGHVLREIATQLYISVQTVKTHRANAMRKVGCRTTADLVRYAMKHGLATS